MARRPRKPDECDNRPIGRDVERVATAKERNAEAARHLALNDFLREHCAAQGGRERSKGQKQTEFQRGEDPRRYTGGKT